MSKPITFSITLLLLLSQITVSHADTLILQQTTLRDAGNGNRPSHTLLVPKGWKVKGGAFWPAPNLTLIRPSQNITVESPDGFGFQISPMIAAYDFVPSAEGAQFGYNRYPEFSNLRGRLIMHYPTSTSEWKQSVRRWSQAAPDPEISDLDVKEVFKFTEFQALLEKVYAGQKRQIESQSRETQAQMGLTQNFRCDAVGVHATFKKNGKNLESLQLLWNTAVAGETRLGKSAAWTLRDIRFFGPKNKLKKRLPQLIALANSMREKPEWTRFINQHMRQIEANNNDSFRIESQIRARGAQQILDIQHRGYQRRSAMNDRMHANYIDSLREIETYRSGDQSYELPSGYDFVYTDGDGSFILTDNSLFRPNVDMSSNVDWTRVQPQRR